MSKSEMKRVTESDTVELMNLYCRKLVEADEKLRILEEWESRAVESMDAACASLGVECCDEIPDKALSLQSELLSMKTRDQVIISLCKIWGGEAMRVVPMLSTQTDF